LKRLAALLLFSQHDIYRGSDDIMTAMSENGHSCRCLSDCPPRDIPKVVSFG
jgi:hypothetical protein